MARNKEEKAVSKAVAVKKGAQLPASAQALIEQDAGAGSEFVTTKDMSMPFIGILQQLSPQVNKRDGAYVDGAEASMMFNTATGQLYDGEKGITVIPCLFQRRYTEWKPRESGGGLVKDWGMDESCLVGTTRDDRNRDINKVGNQITTSATHYVLIVDGDSIERAVISMSSTQSKKSKRWNTQMSTLQLPRSDGQGTFTPPTFYLTYQVTTVPEQNDKGSWFGYKIEPGVPVLSLPGGEAMYLQARAFREAILSGVVKVDANAMASSEEGHPSDTAKAF